MIKEKRKKKKRFLHFLKILSIIIIVLALLFLIALKLFTVKQVEVDGNVLYDDETIENVVLNHKYSWNSLYVFAKYRFKKPESIPFVDTMDITLKSPHKLHIKVYEKGMLGYIYIPGIDENAYFDKDGLVVETSSDIVDGVPKIDGINCDKVVLYEKLPVDDSRLKEILELTQALKREDLIPDSITYGGEGEPVISYGGLTVKMGDTKLLTQKIKRLKAILPSVKDMSGILHLEDWTEDSTNIVFDKTD